MGPARPGPGRGGRWIAAPPATPSRSRAGWGSRAGGRGGGGARGRAAEGGGAAAVPAARASGARASAACPALPGSRSPPPPSPTPTQQRGGNLLLPVAEGSRARSRPSAVGGESSWLWAGSGGQGEVALAAPVSSARAGPPGHHAAHRPVGRRPAVPESQTPGRWGRGARAADSRGPARSGEIARLPSALRADRGNVAFDFLKHRRAELGIFSASPVLWSGQLNRLKIIVDFR